MRNLAEILFLQHLASQIDYNPAPALDAMMKLGRHFAEQGAPNRAELYWIEAGKHGVPHAFLELGRLYGRFCTSVPVCVQKMRLVHKAKTALSPITGPEVGIPEAALNLGLLHEHVSQSVIRAPWNPEDPFQDVAHALLLKAAKYYIMAAAIPARQGDMSPAIAANAVARLYLDNAIGDSAGTNAWDNNKKIAFDYYQMAAEADLGEAQFNLAVLHFCGIGTEVSVVEAEKWLTLAVKNIPEVTPGRPGFKAEAERELAWLCDVLNGTAPHCPAGARVNAHRLSFPEQV